MNHDELFEAYRLTDFIVQSQPSITFKIGQESRELKKVFEDANVSCAAFITAWNPYSRPTAQEDNIKNQNLLIERINKAGLRFIDGVGQDPSGQWPGEPSLLVLGMPRHEAIRLGAEFGQNAIVWIGGSGVPELVSCSDAVRIDG